MRFSARDRSPGKRVTGAHAVPGLIGRRDALGAAFVLGVGLAMSPFAPRPACAAAAPDVHADAAQHFVANLAHKAIAVMADHSVADAQRVIEFHDLFVASFDLLAISQLVLGRYWHLASAVQQAQFLKLFEQQQVLIWSGRFKYFSGQNMTVNSANADIGGRWLVASEVNSVGGKPIPVDWTVALSDNGWRVIDLAIAGVSLALTLRQDFGAVLQAHGGNFDALLAVMQDKIVQLSAG